MASTSTAYVIDAIRTPVGKRNGSLAGIHPIDLGVYAFHGIFDRNDVDPPRSMTRSSDVLTPSAAGAGNIGRLTWLAAGYPEEVPGVTVDRQCGLKPVRRFPLAPKRSWGNGGSDPWPAVCRT